MVENATATLPAIRDTSNMFMLYVSTLFEQILINLFDQMYHLFNPSEVFKNNSNIDIGARTLRYSSKYEHAIFQKEKDKIEINGVTLI